MKSKSFVNVRVGNSYCRKCVFCLEGHDSSALTSISLAATVRSRGILILYELSLAIYSELIGIQLIFCFYDLGSKITINRLYILNCLKII